MSTPAPPATAIDADEVQVGAPNGPGIYIAEVGTEPPDDTTDDWGDGWRILGYASEDGPTIGQSTTSETLTPWQSVAPIRTVITGREMTIQFVMIQLNALTMSVYFDTAEPTTDADGSVHLSVRTDEAGKQYAIGIDSRDGGRVFRVVFGRANLSDAGDMQLTRGAAVPLDVTISALETAGVLADVWLGPASADTDTGNGRSMKPSGNGTGTGKPNGDAHEGGRRGSGARSHHQTPPAPSASAADSAAA